MRPLILEMKAFGSYAEKTVVNFAELQNDLYLITGDTGAGKTTIFDGIMFALFGESSGESNSRAKIRSRSFEMMHCDYVSKSVDTELRFTFVQSGREYTVERIYHFQKERATGEYKKGTQKAYFYEEDKAPIEKNVTDRIIEILGMNAEQFRKIVMLAQGEFKKFLEADSEMKNEILGALFDNSDYVYYQNLLAAAKRKLEEQRNKQGYDEIRSAMRYFQMPEGLSQEEQEVFIAGHSKLKEALEELVEKDTIETEENIKQVQQLNAEKISLTEKKAQIESNNRLLLELQNNRAHVAELEGKKEEREQEDVRLDRVEKAYHQIKPQQDAFVTAKENYETTQNSILVLESKIKELQIAKKEKEVYFEEKRKKQPEIETLTTEITNLTQSLETYLQVNDLRTSLATKQKKLEELQKSVKTNESTLQASQKKIEGYQTKVQSLEGIDGKVVSCGTKLEQLKSKVEKFVGENGIYQLVEEVEKKAQSYVQAEKNYQKRKLDAIEKKKIYDDVYIRFIDGRAGALAQILNQEIEQNQEACCPVCKTKFTADMERHFAEYHDKIPTQEEVDQAKADFEEAENNRKEADVLVKQIATELEAGKNTVYERFREIDIEISRWEQVTAPGYLEEQKERYVQELQEQQKEWESVCSAQKQRKELLEHLIPEEQHNIETIERTLEEIKGQEQEVKNGITEIQTRESEIQKQLFFETKEQAEEEIEKKRNRKIKFQQEMDSAQKELDVAKSELENTIGEYEGKKNDLPRLYEVMQETERQFKRSMANCQFSDETMFIDSLKLVEKEDAEQWIRENQRKKNQFWNDLENTQKRIKELEKQTEEIVHEDVSIIDEKLLQLDENIHIANQQLDFNKQTLNNHTTTYKNISNAMKALEETDAAWTRISKLADLATGGKNTVGGKLSFERYVMGYVFREILEMSNRHLDLMSGGRYELQHERTVSAKNKAAGLEISVLDMTTGKSRDSASLSGGESFLASLALALGLSDVVQNHAGGVQLEALFIDEGFGSLDGDALEKALDVLNRLTEGNRMVGIISHVDKLEESISQKIVVKNTECGSVLKILN